MMLVLALMSFTDRRNANIPLFLVPVIAGMTVLGIGTSYALNCGYAINPARDLGPRLFTAIAGWGGEVFR
jgi:glycerol uptake facilitator-like aquaporin